jgi:hypothetical protein
VEDKLWLVKHNALAYKKQQLQRGRTTFDMAAFNDWASSKPPEYIEMLSRVPEPCPTGSHQCQT